MIGLGLSVSEVAVRRYAVAAGEPTFDGGLIQNGGFDSDGAPWDLSNSFSQSNISGGKLHMLDPDEAGGDIRQTFAAPLNGNHTITYTITDYVSGEARFEFGSSSVLGTPRSANGTYIETVNVPNLSDIRFPVFVFVNLKIDNVRVVPA